MKMISLAGLMGLLLLTSAGFAQGLQMGVKGGANIFKVDGKSFSDEFKFGYNVGIFAELNFNKNWGIQPEILWSQTNFRTGDDFNNVYPGGVNDVKGKLNYLTVPLLLSYRPVGIFAFQVGPQFGILLNQDKNLVGNTREAFKKGDLSLLAGAQLNLAKFKAGARYVIGLFDINDVGDQDKWKNQGFQVYIGVRII
ncbi:MAG: porin family protein [Candidatus Pseudobacter hemicellulosilyticus]|uniref:Porin family protein n=1 Tax=Candidatus Pseudobacter hemicellulosilyticus TaxID=3121375 RepID=A0AAJ5WVI3_9BACT|nr:MAG: porin family protein [Pseudobacter sp.]